MQNGKKEKRIKKKQKLKIDKERRQKRKEAYNSEK
jgi:hypothetical protein